MSYEEIRENSSVSVKTQSSTERRSLLLNRSQFPKYNEGFYGYSSEEMYHEDQKLEKGSEKAKSKESQGHGGSQKMKGKAEKEIKKRWGRKSKILSLLHRKDKKHHGHEEEESLEQTGSLEESRNSGLQSLRSLGQDDDMDDESEPYSEAELEERKERSRREKSGHKSKHGEEDSEEDETPESHGKEKKKKTNTLGSPLGMFSHKKRQAKKAERQKHHVEEKKKEMAALRQNYKATRNVKDTEGML